MKKIILAILLVIMLATSVTANLSANKEDFSDVNYDSKTGKLGGSEKLLYATKTIDSGDVILKEDPFYLSLKTSDVPEITRDDEGNIISVEQESGSVLLNKTMIDSFIGTGELATKDYKYKTTTIDDESWYEIELDDFNKELEWKVFDKPTLAEKWFTWGSDAFKFETRAMYIELIEQSPGHLKFDITHDSDSSGQPITV